MQIDDTLAFLLGRWSIRRVICDHRDASEIHFDGTATVEPGPGGALYVETGRIRRGTHSGSARRSLRMVRRPDGSVRLEFQDGRPFVDLDLGAACCAVTHPCRADLYEMGFEVFDSDRIRETWRVRGPEKDYDAETIWARG